MYDKFTIWEIKRNRKKLAYVAIKICLVEMYIGEITNTMTLNKISGNIEFRISKSKVLITFKCILTTETGFLHYTITVITWQNNTDYKPKKRNLS